MDLEISIKISISDETFQKFFQRLADNDESMNDVIEKMMLTYAEGNPYPGGTDENGGEIDEIGGETDEIGDIPSEYSLLTKKLLDKFRGKAVGILARFGLRGLLERGVAPESEITEFQKASGSKQVEKYHIEYGQHVSAEFGLSFPLLITTDRKEFDNPQKFLIKPLKIYGNEYHLCSQWVEGLHRDKLEAWIRKSLSAWLQTADEQSREEMIHWIEFQL